MRTVSHLRGDGDGVDAEEVISTVANMFKDNIVHSVTSDVMSVTKKIIYDANGWLKKRIKANHRVSQGASREDGSSKAISEERVAEIRRELAWINIETFQEYLESRSNLTLPGGTANFLPLSPPPPSSSYSYS